MVSFKAKTKWQPISLVPKTRTAELHTVCHGQKIEMDPVPLRLNMNYRYVVVHVSAKILSSTTMAMNLSFFSLK